MCTGVEAAIVLRASRRALSLPAHALMSTLFLGKLALGPDEAHR
jgi:hypothetical protein